MQRPTFNFAAERQQQPLRPLIPRIVKRTPNPPLLSSSYGPGDVRELPLNDGVVEPTAAEMFPARPVAPPMPDPREGRMAQLSRPYEAPPTAPALVQAPTRDRRVESNRSGLAGLAGAVAGLLSGASGGAAVGAASAMRGSRAGDDRRYGQTLSEWQRAQQVAQQQYGQAQNDYNNRLRVRSMEDATLRGQVADQDRQEMIAFQRAGQKTARRQNLFSTLTRMQTPAQQQAYLSQLAASGELDQLGLSDAFPRGADGVFDVEYLGQPAKPTQNLLGRQYLSNLERLMRDATITPAARQRLTELYTKAVSVVAGGGVPDFPIGIQPGEVLPMTPNQSGALGVRRDGLTQSGRLGEARINESKANRVAANQRSANSINAANKRSANTITAAGNRVTAATTLKQAEQTRRDQQTARGMINKLALEAAQVRAEIIKARKTYPNTKIMSDVTIPLAQRQALLRQAEEANLNKAVGLEQRLKEIRATQRGIALTNGLRFDVGNDGIGRVK